MTLDEFLQMQANEDAIKAAEVAELSPPIAVDEYLTTYRVGSGDVLNVTMTGLDGPTLSSSFRARVDHAGRVDLPLVGEIDVVGKDEANVEDAIKAAYVPQIVRELTVNVEVATFETTNVVVTGAAETPGLVPLRRTERNLLYAVAAAGGVSSGASGRVSVSRVREPGVIESFNLTDPSGLAQSLTAGPLLSGDIVTIEAARPNTVFVGGLVNRPGQQFFATGVPYTLLQVIASAGGLRSDVLPRIGNLIRRMPDGSDVRVKLDLDRIKRGDDPNIVVSAGDILWIPDTWDTRLQDFVNRNLFIRAGFSLNYNMSGIDFLNSAAKAQSLQGSNLENSFDPLGFLTRNAALQTLSTAPPPTP